MLPPLFQQHLPFLFQFSPLYFNSTCHFPLKQVSYNMSLSISEIITKKAGRSSTFADLHSECPFQMSAITIATVTVCIISFNQLWQMQVQHFNLANTATFQILPFFIQLSFYNSILYTTGSTDRTMMVQ
jgi:hypothetical protein